MIRRAAATSLVAIALLLAGCSSTEPGPSGSTTQPSVAPASPSANPSTSTTPAALTCDTLVDANVRASLITNHWQITEEPFRIGDEALKTGFLCAWSPADPGSTSLQLYGYSPLSASEATAAEQKLTDAGWKREDAPDGIYITENPDTTVVTDSDGYGMTYLFGSGWVIVSDTKQGLLVMNPPGTPAG